ncbi:MAG: hypothetical protein ACRDUX_22140 [Mycobacterium sp.]
MSIVEPSPSVVSATRLSNSFLGELIEICFVTADYRRTMAGLVRLGIGPWLLRLLVTRLRFASKAADEVRSLLVAAVCPYW